ncbi:MAG: Smr/MutS family protein [Caulobacter sp.]|nr:Smr/MutS family protein [Caulobacter sp.]
MPRKLKADEAHLWGHVTATVRPLPGRLAPNVISPPAEGAPAHLPLPKTPAAPKAKAVRPPEAIEPGRQKRIVRGHEPLEARIDLHGMTHDRARAALESFLLRVWSEGCREALVITGKGVQGDGVLRRFTPEWLAVPPLREIVAGVSQAHRRHGGEGALYVALKRKGPA